MELLDYHIIMLFREEMGSNGECVFLNKVVIIPLQSLCISLLLSLPVSLHYPFRIFSQAHFYPISCSLFDGLLLGWSGINLLVLDFKVESDESKRIYAGLFRDKRLADFLKTTP